MTVDKLSSESGSKYATITFGYDELKDLINGLYQLTKKEVYEVIDKADEHNPYLALYPKLKSIFDMMKYGGVQPETVVRMYQTQTNTLPETSALTDEEIQTFNAYLEAGDLKTAFGNTDWNRIYRKIVGEDGISDKLEKRMSTERSHTAASTSRFIGGEKNC